MAFAALRSVGSRAERAVPEQADRPTQSPQADGWRSNLLVVVEEWLVLSHTWR